MHPATLQEFFASFTASNSPLAQLMPFVAALWVRWIYISYALSFLGFVLMVYCMMRLFALREEEEHELGELIPAPGSANEVNPRWQHIQTLIGQDSQSAWREAIIEADILLDDMLTRQGYRGEGVGEKLKEVEPSDFSTVEDAWEAHKVRNQIAHQGSVFDLSPTVARRTIAHYETVFREFGLL